MIVVWIKAIAMEMKKNGRHRYIVKIELIALDDGFVMGGKRKGGI